MALRWTITSETSISDRSSTAPSMRRSRLSMAPSSWWYSTAPRISSWAAKTPAFMSMFTPNSFSVLRTIHWMASTIGSSSLTKNRTNADRPRATSSGRVMAKVLGSTSTNTSTSAVITAVAITTPQAPGTTLPMNSVARAELRMLIRL